jgi:hypothetical protein
MKKDKCEKQIIVIGAARSGTSMLANIIKQNINVTYLGEINEIWKKFSDNKDKKYDTIPLSYATASTVEKLWKRFNKECEQQGSSVLLEKTAANSLRVSFVLKIFPNARFVHIVRDGRDVAISARKKCLGDSRKITKENIEKNKNDKKTFLRLIKLFNHKIRYGLTFKEIIINFNRYFAQCLSIAGIRKKVIWGPKFPRIEDIYKNYSLLEACAIQWKICTENIIKFKDENKHINILEVKYEELIEHPKENIKKILEFLKIENISEAKINDACKSIIKTKKGWQQILTDKEKENVSKIVDPLLKKLGYQKTINNI